MKACLIPVLGLLGCSQLSPHTQVSQQCIGEIIPPAGLVPVEDNALLSRSLGRPQEGGLCHAKAYKVVEGQNLTVYRAYNSTNPHSRIGNWWSFHLPQGAVSTYRRDNAICYEFSPLDRLVRCKLKPGTELVIGTGQSVKCSQYLSYPPSPTNQVYLEVEEAQLDGCENYRDEFSWKEEVRLTY